MSADPGAPLEAHDTAARKAELFAYLDDAVGAGALLAEIALQKPVPALCHVEPVRLPRHVWLYWHDGWEAAPEIVKLCLRSWQERNPQHEVHALDWASLPQFLPKPPVHKHASKLNGLANRVRLKLLRTHGGVWADATLFCTQPLDAWLPMLMPMARMFAFASPAPDRIVATWFLASMPHAPLMRAWERVYAAYFDKLESEGRWIHAYFAMAYILEYIAARHPELHSVWEAMPKVPAPESGRVATIASLREEGMPQTHALSPEQRREIAQTLKSVVMQKLTWKGAVRDKTPAAAQVLEILKAELDGRPGAGPAR